MLKQRADAVGTAYQGEAAAMLAPTAQPDERGGPRLEDGRPFRPFDHRDGIRGRFVQSGIDPRQAVEPIEIVMLKWQAACVTVMQHEGRAVHRATHAQPLGKTLHELGLPASKVTLEGDDIACLHDLTEAVSQRSGLFNGPGLSESVHTRRSRALL